MPARSILHPAFDGDDDFPKYCPRCGQTKTRKDFAKHATTRDRRQKFCKPCQRTVQHEIKERRRKQGLPSYHVTERRRRRLEVLTHYSNGHPQCACCGEKHLEFLSIDHINGGGNKHRQKEGYARIYRWLRQHDYPDGYRVLCHNCNQSIGLYGYCPHANEPKTEIKPEDKGL